MPRMPTLRVRIPDRDLQELERIAEERQIKLSDLVRRLLSKALREKQYEQV